MPSLSTTPAQPLPGRICKVSAVATHGGQAIRIWCTAAPRDSALRKKLDESGASRVAFATVEAGKDFDFTPDKGGGYVLRLDELIYDKPGGIPAHFTGDYEGDPRGAKHERIATTSSTTLYVAEGCTSQLGFGNDRATLVIHIFGAAIMQARKDVHGVVSPRIDLPSQPTAKARIAAESQDVLFALSRFTNTDGLSPPELVLGDPAEIIDQQISALNFHLRGSAVHEVSASDQQIPDEFLHPSTNAGMVASLNKLRTTLDRHVRNDDGSGTGTAGWHDGEEGRVSWNAVPLVAATEQTIDACIADINRCLRLHLENGGVHSEGTNAGGVPNLPEESILIGLHESFLEQIAAADPSAPANSNPLGAQFIARGWTAT